VELPDGSFLASWYRGSGERKADDVAVFGARLPRGSQSWSDPFVMIDTPGFPDGNTAMMVDAKGSLHLFWPLVVANTWESCVTQQLVSLDPIGTGSPKWDRKECLWLKPDDFSAEANSKLDALLDTLPKPLSKELQGKVDEVRGRRSMRYADDLAISSFKGSAGRPDANPRSCNQDGFYFLFTRIPTLFL
ncbi:MAG: exo-alpha-sialidase, partial [Planctomycetota bacterium]|nr:exo-alpha-sialidase [Planctomycetota bacterium]